MVAEDQFKSYEELQTKLNEVLGEGPSVQERQAERHIEAVEQKSEFDDYFKADKPAETATAVSTSNDDEDLEDYFKSLAAD